MQKRSLVGGALAAAGLVTLFSVALSDTDAAKQGASDKPVEAPSLTYREIGTAAQNYPDFQGKSIGESGELPVRQGDWATTVIQVGLDDPQTASTSRVLLHYVDGAWTMVASDDARKFCNKVPDKIQVAMSCS